MFMQTLRKGVPLLVYQFVQDLVKAPYSLFLRILEFL